MSTNVFSLVDQLSDQDLVAQVKLLAQGERDATASLIAHLAVLDERGLYRAEGYSSTFTYCLQVLHLSEHAAYGRIEAARAARRYPIILELLANGSVNLTTVMLLAPHLTRENHVGVLQAARHQRKRHVEEIVARLRPQPAVPSSIRRLPAPNRTLESPSGAECDAARLDSSDEVPLLTLATPIRPAVVAPLAPERYKVQFTASVEMHEKLRLTQELLRHQIPDGDIAQVIDRALSALLKDLKRQKFAATDQPNTRISGRVPGDRSAASRTRQIPAEVRRKVWVRDGGRCAFVAQNGHRCTERGFLEFHHVVPYSAGGEATADNIQLRCRAHNGFEAELFFGQHNDGVRLSTRSGPSWSGATEIIHPRKVRAPTSFI